MKNIAGSKYKILERKSSKFGSLTVDVRNELSTQYTNKGRPMSYYDNMNRLDLYRTCLDKYVHDQVARPLINAIVQAIFSEPPDFQGDEELTKRAKQIVRDSEIDWNNWGVDLEVHGDLFIRSFFGKKAKIVSIPAQSVEVKYNETNVLDILGYTQFPGTGQEKNITPEEISHAKINNTSNMVYGESILRAVLWWLDVLDNLWERNWIRAAQYYGAPIVAITGVPGEHQAAVKAALETDGQRPGKNWIFPEDVKVEALDFTKNYPIELLIDRVYQYVLAACGVPQHMIYETDSSRGVAMFSGDAFNMLIKSRQRTWELALIRSMRLIFEDEGLWKDDSKFNVQWAPVFLRDLKNISSMMQVAVDNEIISRQTAREMIGVDHSEEEERMKDEPLTFGQELEKKASEKPIPAPGVPKPVAAKPKAKPKK